MKDQDFDCFYNDENDFFIPHTYNDKFAVFKESKSDLFLLTELIEKEDQFGRKRYYMPDDFLKNAKYYNNRSEALSAYNKLNDTKDNRTNELHSKYSNYGK